MKRLLFFAGLLFAACQQNTITTSASLIGTHDLVFVDQLGEDGTLASVTTVDGQAVANGLPSRYLFLTSADTNELRILELYRPNTVGRDWMRAPNPLETLSIPVLDRPTMLATGEGRNAVGQRASGQLVFAARPGGAEVSIVSLALRRQLGGHPLATPAPVTAIGGSIAVGADQRPGASTLYVATWDGATSGVVAVELDPDPTAVDRAVAQGTATFRRLTTVDAHPLSALFVIAPLAGRTVDGAPFCATSTCLALSTRVSPSTPGEAFLFELATGRSVKLGFSGPIRKFAAGTVTRRLYALLDEASCGGPQCGGVVAVDLVTGTTAGGFPGSKDTVGRPFGPLRLTEGLLTGLSIAQGGVVKQIAEGTDGGLSGLVQQYDELGAFASSDGLITWFSGSAGSVIDYDGRRSRVAGGLLRLPVLTEDGGATLVGADGGAVGSLIPATVDTPLVLEETWRVSTVTIPEPASTWTVDVSDGYLVTQSVRVINQGFLPGLVNLPTTSADGTRLAVTTGAERRAQPGDVVVFQTGAFVECGRATVAAINTGSLDVDAVPAGCGERAAFSVQAAATGPRSWVVVASSDGYLGRSGPGEQFTYTKPPVLITADVIADRTALTITMAGATALVGEGSYLDLSIQSHMTPLRVSIDANSQGLTRCSSTLAGQVVFGNLAMLQAPTSTNGQSTVNFPWRAWAVVPSGNAVVELSLDYLRAGGTALNYLDNAGCYR